jgi:hypothetical protein
MKNLIFKTGVSPVRFPAARLLGTVLILTAAFMVSNCEKAQDSAESSVAIIATKDNSIYGAQRVNSTSNGKGDFLIAGMVRTPGYIRRALIQFDIPKCFIEKAVGIDSVTVSLWSVIEGHHNAHGKEFDLYAVPETWGEGCSDGGPGRGANAQPGDATWNSRYVTLPYPTDSSGILWSVPGVIRPVPGQQLATFTFPSDTSITEVNAVWRSQDLTNAVVDWYKVPCTNNGLIIVGPEIAPDDTLTAASFYSKDACVSDSLKPTLTIYYTTTGGKKTAVKHTPAIAVRKEEE